MTKTTLHSHDVARAAGAFADIADALSGQKISRGGYKTQNAVYTYGQDPIVSTITHSPVSGDNAGLKDAMGVLSAMFERRGLKVVTHANSLEANYSVKDLPFLTSMRDKLVPKVD